MKFDEAMEYMENTVNPLGSVLGLSVMEELAKRLGNPERELKVIHVAGTNGKGSVSSFIAGALMANGCKVGRYISPSVLDYREKIQVNGTYIPKTRVAEYLTKLFEIGKEMLSYFSAKSHDWTVDDATFDAYVCASSEDVRGRLTFDYQK